MQLNHKSVLCHYRYDALDRLTASESDPTPSAQYFYQKDRLTTEIQGAVMRLIMQHDGQLLVQKQCQASTLKTHLFATDLKRSVLNASSSNGPPLPGCTPYGYCPVGINLFSLLVFNGERPDLVTGCYLLGNGYRAFNPVLMRFNSPDSESPFGKGGLNTYAYCEGDPVNRSDPTGHWSPLAALFNADFGFLSGMWRTTKQSLRRSSLPTSNTMSPARRHVDQVVSAVVDPQPFVQRLESVNSNLASHGNSTLPMEHAKRYEQLVKDVGDGTISNTGAHVESATMWAQKYDKDRRPSDVVGVVFNGVGGTLLSGVYDHGLQKTGKAIRR